MDFIVQEFPMPDHRPKTPLEDGGPAHYGAGDNPAISTCHGIGLRKGVPLCLVAAGSIALLPLLVAWSSKSFPPPFQEVHQKAIDAVLSTQLGESDLKILRGQQRAVDGDQEPKQSYEHAMTGLMKKGDTTNTLTTNFIQFAETFVRTNLAAAIQARHAGSTQFALQSLGRALHPLEDATSPAHKPFQPWKYNESLGEALHHIWIERAYPDDPHDTNQVAELAELKGVVQYGFDIYMERITNPARFFNPTNGVLELPTAYLYPAK
jgi:hypothetical protein